MWWGSQRRDICEMALTGKPGGISFHPLPLTASNPKNCKGAEGMDYPLQRDLDWFFDVSPALAKAIEQMLANELGQLKDSTLARVEKYIQSGT